MKNYFRGKIITKDVVINDLEKLFNLTSLGMVDDEKSHVLDYLTNLDDKEKEQYICKNIVSFNKQLNIGGYGMNPLANIFCYIGFIGLVENGFSLIKDLDMDEIALLSSYVYRFITHPDYPENINLPFLTEKSILSAITSRIPTSISYQCSILSSVEQDFIGSGSLNTKNIETYISNLSDDEITLIDTTQRIDATKGVAL